MGRCLIGASAADSGTMYKAGDKLGEEKHTIVPSEMPIHGHTGTTAKAGGHNHNRGDMEIWGGILVPMTLFAANKDFRHLGALFTQGACSI
jgi:hypothetical protein